MGATGSASAATGMSDVSPGVGYTLVGSQLANAGAEAYMNYEAGKYAEEIQKYNRDIAMIQARDARARGAEQEFRFRQDVRRLIGSQRAVLAAQGIELDEGTALELQQDTARQAELDALTIRNNAIREAWGYRVQATGYSAAASVERALGIQRVTGSILTGLGRAGATYSALNQSGVFSRGQPVLSQSISTGDFPTIGNGIA